MRTVKLPTRKLSKAGVPQARGLGARGLGAKALGLLALVCLVAAACATNDNDPASGSVGTAQLSASQQGVADAAAALLREHPERTDFITDADIDCLAEAIATAFSDGRLAELGLDGPSIAASFQNGGFSLGDSFGISDEEEAAIVNSALPCLDWRSFAAASIAEDVPAEQADCIAAEISDASLESLAASMLISQSGADVIGLGSEAGAQAFQNCFDVREELYQTFVLEGRSEDEARCIADGMPQEMIDIMLGAAVPEDPEAGAGLASELAALEARCVG